LCPETAAQFLYRAQKNVVYNRNVMRNKKLNIPESWQAAASVPPQKTFLEIYAFMLFYV
jgi:hypothetical protein